MTEAHKPSSPRLARCQGFTCRDSLGKTSRVLSKVARRRADAASFLSNQLLKHMPMASFPHQTADVCTMSRNVSTYRCSWSHGGVEGQTSRWSWPRTKSAFTRRHGRCSMHVDLQLVRDLNICLALGKHGRSISVGLEGQ